MAGINLARKLGQRPESNRENTRSGVKSSFLSSLFKSSTSTAAESAPLSSGTKIKALLGILGILSIFLGRSMVQDEIQLRETQKREDIAKIDTEMAALKKKMDSLKGIAAEAAVFDAQMADFQRRIDLIEKIGTNRNLAIRMADFVVTRMPKELWLTKLNLSTALDSKVEVEGSAHSFQQVSLFLKELESAVFFPKWTLVETTQPDNRNVNGKSSSTVRTFRMNAPVTIP